MGVPLAHGEVNNPHAVFSPPVPEVAEQVVELLLKCLVEVEVDEGVVDVGALGKEGREHKASRGHVLVPFVENEEEGHDRIGRPGDHKTQADAEKHLEKGCKQKQTTCKALKVHKSVPTGHAKHDEPKNIGVNEHALGEESLFAPFEELEGPTMCVADPRC